MLSIELWFVVACLGASFFIAAMGIPLLYGWVRPNGVYGIRSPLTLRDEQAWYPANRVCGFWLLMTGLATAGVSTGMYAAGIPLAFCLFFTLVTVLTGVIVMMVQSDAAARRRAVGKMQLQFRLLTFFAVTAVVAVGCAIARLPAPWIFKIGLLWAYAICVLGLTIGNFQYWKPRAD